MDVIPAWLVTVNRDKLQKIERPDPFMSGNNWLDLGPSCPGKSDEEDN